MNLIVNKFWLVFLILLSFFSVKALIISAYLFEKNNQRILILGDYHPQNSRDIEEINLENDLQFVKVSRWLLKLKQFGRSVHFISEYSNRQFLAVYPGFQKEIENEKFTQLFLAFPILVLGIEASYRWVENRVGILLNFIRLMSTFKKYNYNVSYALNDKVREKFKDDSVEDLLIFISNEIMHFERRYKKFENQPAYEFLNLYFNELKSLHEIVKAFFYGSENKKLIEYLLEIENKYTSNIIRELYIKYFIPLTNNLIQNALLRAVAKDINKFEDIVCYCSDGHTKAIVNLLNFLGYNMLYQKNIKCYSLLNVVQSPMSPIYIKELAELLKKAFDRSCKSFEVCVVCFKDTKNVCSKCNSVYYCSKKCQTDHWRLHKKFCV